MTTITASPISPATRNFRNRLAPALENPRAAESFSVLFKSKRVPSRAGASPKSNPVRSAMASVKISTCPSTATLAVIWNVSQAARRNCAMEPIDAAAWIEWPLLPNVY